MECSHNQEGITAGGGITSRWKQTIAYHYTGNSADGQTFKPIVFDIIKKATDIGLHVIAVTNDMGSGNRALWRSFRIVCSRYSQTVNKIPHPSAPQRWLYVLADVPRVIKNMKTGLVSGQVFTLAKDVVESNKLPSSEVSIISYPYKNLPNVKNTTS